MDLNGKVALVTGGARVGRAVARDLAGRGCALALVYRSSRTEAETTAREALDVGVRAQILRADLSRAKEIPGVVARVHRHFGRLDVVVHLASVYQKAPEKLLSRFKSRAALWDQALAVDARAAYHLAWEAAPHLRRDGGRIVLVSDWTAASGRPRYKGYGPYYVAQSAVRAVTETLALELAPSVLVNAVAPGPILAPEGLSTAEKAAVVQGTPLGRWGGPEAVARAVVFLAESDFITGETLRVDGGRHLL
jgi:NAD(P)-dependent dehydrogenase (short-subunit alcohol dehydrogenase family)